MSRQPYQALGAVLAELEPALRQLGLWHPQPPSAEALASRAPFAIDTLTFSQWLQFVFLPRMEALLEQRQPLPRKCAIAPMAEEYFAPQNIDATEVLELLRRIDTLLS